MDELIRVARDARLLRITLNRPSKRNALNLELCCLVCDTVEAADPVDVGCILLDAEGQSFCAGMDLRESLQVDSELLARTHERLFSLHRRAKVPIIAFVQGHALAGGTGLAAQAHIVIADPAAEFGLTEIAIGMWPLLVYRSMEAAIGSRRTLEWSLTGRTIGATEALEAGLVHRIGAHDQALALAKEIASRGAEAVATGMEYYNRSRGLSFENAGQLAAGLRERLLQSEVYKVATARFRTKD
jgi:enoyl-CoA hydratase/carnithine racemase